jgi:hypothetical protein
MSNRHPSNTKRNHMNHTTEQAPNFKTEADVMAPLDAMKKVFMARLIDEFKDFVADAIDEGYHDEFDDHFDFLKMCLQTFADLKDYEAT